MRAWMLGATLLAACGSPGAAGPATSEQPEASAGDVASTDPSPERPDEGVVDDAPVDEVERAYREWVVREVETMPAPRHERAGDSFVIARIDAGRAFAHGDVDAQTVLRRGRRRSNAIRSCYEPCLEEHPDLVGRLVVRFRIEPGGSVSDVRAAEETTLEDPELVACAVSALAELRFDEQPPSEATAAAFAVNLGMVQQVGR